MTEATDPDKLSPEQVQVLRSALGICLAIFDDDPDRAKELGELVPYRDRWYLVVTLAALVNDLAHEIAEFREQPTRECLEQYVLAGLNLEGNTG